ALLFLERGAQLDLVALEPDQLVALAADQREPGHGHDQRGQQHAEDDLGLLRPRTDVVEIQLADLDLLFLAHDAGPPVVPAAGALPCSPPDCCAPAASAGWAASAGAPA